MTYLDERDDTIQYCLITSFSLATLAVAIYLAFGNFFAAYFAIGLYALSFIAISLFSIRKIFLVLNFKEKLSRYESDPNNDIMDLAFVERKNNALRVVRSALVKETIKTIVSGAFALFAIVVLVLF